MTKREILLANCIKLNRKEVLNHSLSSNLIPKQLAVINKLQSRLKLKIEKKAETDITIFGRSTVYPDGTKHFISNTWFS